MSVNFTYDGCNQVTGKENQYKMDLLPKLTLRVTIESTESKFKKLFKR